MGAHQAHCGQCPQMIIAKNHEERSLSFCTAICPGFLATVVGQLVRSGSIRLMHTPISHFLMPSHTWVPGDFAILPAWGSLRSWPLNWTTQERWRGWQSWLHNWQLRAGSLPNNHPVRDYELGRAQSALAIFRGHYSRGTAPRIRSLIDDQVVQFLGGPATHPFTPGLDERIHEIAIRAGLEDSARRYGTSPTGIWVPECAYRPGQEGVYQQLGITHFMVDEPAVVAVGGKTLAFHTDWVNRW